MVVTSWMPSSSSMALFRLISEGVSYFAIASCSSGVLRWIHWIRVNPGGTLSASVRCWGSGSSSFSAALAHDGVVKLRSEVS